MLYLPTNQYISNFKNIKLKKPGTPKIDSIPVVYILSGIIMLIGCTIVLYPYIKKLLIITLFNIFTTIFII